MNTQVLNNRFEITGDDIALLDDAALRNLIGLLCEADCRTAGLSATHVTYGGHQDAPDGGIDVEVKTPHPFPHNVAILRSHTAFQVKTQAMRPSEISDEMKPKGVLRSAIQALIKNRGAYIIISSKDSTTASSLEERLRAMKEAVSEQDTEASLHIDFYDRTRIATWVRMYPSLVLWVRDQIGRALPGWRPYCNWAKSPEGIEEEYLIDEGLRLRDDTQDQSQNPRISIQEGLDRIRQKLAMPRSVVRLVGLSGVGKTRLVQALFDARIGEGPLDQKTVFYTDISDSPHPTPQQLVEQLIAENAKGTLVIDNCPPDLHQRLAELCISPASRLSLLTVEYDVRNETLSDETNVFHLEPSSEELITRVLRKRFPHINEIDADTISKASGGNYRIGIAIANTVRKGENLAGLTDMQLFKRLFEQQQGSSDRLMLNAGVLSLVYSFDGDNTSDRSELKTLASLIEKPVLEFYKDVAELKNRDLVQSRSIWRAVLPHAIANMLAKHALECIPKDIILTTFLEQGTERLILSLSRRLGYLHDSPVAVAIVNDLLAEGGWLGDVRNLNKFGMNVFSNLAPASPEKALETIERAAKSDPTSLFLSRENDHFYEYVCMLRSIAYDKNLFKRCTNLICDFALSEKEGQNYNSIRAVLKSLFYAYLSGTHAKETERLQVIEGLLVSDNKEKQSLGIALLDITLNAQHFTAVNTFSFGGRKRDYGYYPQGEEIRRWYTIFIKAAEKLANSQSDLSSKTRQILASRFRGLWTQAHMFDELESVATHLHQIRAWNEGWMAVRKTISFAKKNMDREIIERLEKIERLLSPSDLIEKSRVYALSNRYDRALDSLDEEDASAGRPERRRQRIDQVTFELGVQVAQNTSAFETLLPELVKIHPRPTNLFTFGRGLAQGSVDKEKTWSLLKEQLSRTKENERNVQVLLGMISRAENAPPTLCNTWLDEALHDTTLKSWFPHIQFAFGFDARGLERLHQALDQDIAPIELYHDLVYSRTRETVSDDDLSQLLNKIASKENGQSIALEILCMRFSDANTDHSQNLLNVARKILSEHSFSRDRGVSDYTMVEIAKKCFDGEDGASTATTLLQNLLVSLSNYSVYHSDFPLLTNTIAETYPRIFLDVFWGGYDKKKLNTHRAFSRGFDLDKNPLDQIPDEEIISWCHENPEERYSFIVRAIKAFDDPSESHEDGQWRPITLLIFKYAPDIDVILNAIGENLRPTAWSGSLSRIMKGRLKLFPQLFNHENAKISEWAKETHENLQRRIPILEEEEEDLYREEDERFEW
ncbi:MAG: hypothetical protein MUC87_06930 [Bacteroidia bacterium]|jgi:hypothetical protein|nr:hypothetical protein [Bacteroidia bacterium]